MYFICALLLSAIIGAMFGAPGWLVVALFGILWIGSHLAARTRSY